MFFSRKGGSGLAVKDGLQKVVSIRLNLAREDEKRLYNEIMSHGRNVPDDIYGSSGAYVKAALSAYGADREKSDREHMFGEQMKDYLEMLSRKQSEDFLDKLAEHDDKLTEKIMGIVQNVLTGLAGSGMVQMMAQEGERLSGMNPDPVQSRKYLSIQDAGIADGTARQPEMVISEMKSDVKISPDSDAEGTVIATLDEEPEAELPAGAMDFLDSFC